MSFMGGYLTYIVVNVTLQEVYFGLTNCELKEIFSTVFPPETAHWDHKKEYIGVPVLISKELSYESALLDLQDLVEKAFANPQGKTILKNHLLKK